MQAHLDENPGAMRIRRRAVRLPGSAREPVFLRPRACRRSPDLGRAGCIAGAAGACSLLLAAQPRQSAAIQHEGGAGPRDRVRAGRPNRRWPRTQIHAVNRRSARSAGAGVPRRAGVRDRVELLERQLIDYRELAAEMDRQAYVHAQVEVVDDQEETVAPRG